MKDTVYRIFQKVAQSQVFGKKERMPTLYRPLDKTIPYYYIGICALDSEVDQRPILYKIRDL
jgi:hypothetical protein